MIVIQRVRARWGTSGRSAADANRRRQIPRSLLLPQVPDEPVVAHDVLASEATDYQPQARLTTGDAGPRAMGVWFTSVGGDLMVDRLPHHPSAYPIRRGPDRLFTLSCGQVGRYLTNYRLTTEDAWFYEDWTIHIVQMPAPPDPSIFLTRTPHIKVDQRVSLYGERRRG